MVSFLKLPNGSPLFSRRVGIISAMASSMLSSSKPSSPRLMGIPRLAKNMRVSSMADSASDSISPVGARPNTS